MIQAFFKQKNFELKNNNSGIETHQYHLKNFKQINFKFKKQQ